MVILGINISHDASSCLIKDNKIIYFCEEERIAKKKHYEFEHENTKFYGISKLKKYGITEIDHVIFASFRRTDETQDKSIMDNIQSELRQAGIKVLNINYDPENHHIYHACSAFFGSGFEEAAALVMDGRGAHTAKYPYYRELESIYKFYPAGISTEYKHYSKFDQKFLNHEIINDPHEIMLSNAISSGQLFLEWSLNLGLVEVGKYMGLSSYGILDDDEEWINYVEGNPIFNTRCVNRIVEHGKVNIKWSSHTKEFQRHANIAKKVQHETKVYTIKLIRKALDRAKTSNIVLSGGYFLNCVNNYEYIKAFPGVNFYIDPMAYDGGTALGAAVFQYKLIHDSEAKIEPIKNLYLGGQ
jgi:carbamoyltransferase